MTLMGHITGIGRRGGLTGTMYGASNINTRAIGSGLSRLVGNYNRAYAQAKTANEQRYQQLLGIADKTSGQRAADIRSGAGTEKANIFQRLARSGLGSSSVGNVEAAGVNRRKEEALDRSADLLQGTKLGIIERRQDPYPDQASLASLITGIGSSAGPGGLQGLVGALAGLKF